MKSKSFSKSEMNLMLDHKEILNSKIPDYLIWKL